VNSEKSPDRHFEARWCFQRSCSDSNALYAKAAAGFEGLSSRKTPFTSKQKKSCGGRNVPVRVGRP